MSENVPESDKFHIIFRNFHNYTTFHLQFTQTNTSNIWNNTHIMMSSVHQVNRAFLSCIARAYAIGEQKDNLKEDHLIKSELVYNYTLQKSY